jgi:hypothetical protein
MLFNLWLWQPCCNHEGMSSDEKPTWFSVVKQKIKKICVLMSPLRWINVNNVLSLDFLLYEHNKYHLFYDLTSLLLMYISVASNISYFIWHWDKNTIICLFTSMIISSDVYIGVKLVNQNG